MVSLIVKCISFSPINPKNPWFQSLRNCETSLLFIIFWTIYPFLAYCDGCERRSTLIIKCFQIDFDPFILNVGPLELDGTLSYQNQSPTNHNDQVTCGKQPYSKKQHKRDISFITSPVLIGSIPIYLYLVGFKKGFSFSKMETLMVCSQHHIISSFWSFQRDIQHEK